MDAATRRREADHWSQYWRHGFLHSCHSAYEHNYRGEILRTWRAFFAQAPTRGRVLDIGTGNGAVALIARDSARAHAKKLEIVAIDRARIAPDAAATAHRLDFSDIRFKAETCIEATGLPAEAFDLVSGQFALEYSNLEQALAELARITRRGARLGFVMHHHQSLICRTAVAECAHYKFLFDEVRLLECVRKLVEAIGDRRTSEELIGLAKAGSAEPARLEYNRAATRVTDRIACGSAVGVLKELLGAIAHVLNHRSEWGSRRALSYIDRLELEHRCAMARLEDQVRAAITHKQLLQLGEMFVAQGFDPPQVSVLHLDQGSVLAWWVRSHKR